MINKRLSVTSLVLAPLLIIAANTAYATTVYPTGVYPTDLNNVQNAVNAGGTVLLKATNTSGVATSFNFNIWNSFSYDSIPANSDVQIGTVPVSITGETIGANKTTVLGGCVPFYDGNSAVKVSINGIKFVNPQGAAIAFFKSGGVTITNNEIANPLKYQDENNLIESSGIYVSGVNNTAATGPVVISGNYIHGLDGTYEFGIGLFDVESASTVTANTIVIGDATDSGNGSTEAEAIGILNCTGATIASGNTITIDGGVGKYGIASHGPNSGAVTMTANQVSVASGATCYEALGVNGSTGKTTIVGNLLSVNNYGTNAIELNGSEYIGTLSGAIVSANVISLPNSYSSAIEVNGAVTSSSISLNLITGLASYGISSQSDGNTNNNGQLVDLATSNTYLSNLFIGFSVYSDDLFLDVNTSHNTVLGAFSSILNNGTSNTIIKL